MTSTLRLETARQNSELARWSKHLIVTAFPLGTINGETELFQGFRCSPLWHFREIRHKQQYAYAIRLLSSRVQCPPIIVFFAVHLL